jgi:eukaryotic-like serine/threonine-protein kinase
LLSLQSATPTLALGRYLLFDEIASGGMASVHFGRLSGPAGFSRVVAIKRLHPNFAKDPEFVTMFLDEARLAARIRHPNVVPTLDVVAIAREIFLVMDYVHGQSLAKLWRAVRAANKPTDPRIVATVMGGVLHGLHAAHDAKGERGELLEIVHRDVSPQNILVGVDGVARVLDFGVAKAAGRVQMTRKGDIKGKIAYMPPEQLNGETVTRQTDVYAAAVVTWEMLTGKRAFTGKHEGAVVSAILAEPLSPPSKVAPHVPPAFDDVVMRGLHRNPARRQATAKELALDLERCSGIVSMSDVGAWVEVSAQADLARRALCIAAIEGAPPAGVFRAPSRPAASEMPTRPSHSGRDRPSDGPSAVSRVALSPTVSRLLRRSREHVAIVLSTIVFAMASLLLFARWMSGHPHSPARPATAPPPAAAAPPARVGARPGWMPISPAPMAPVPSTSSVPTIPLVPIEPPSAPDRKPSATPRPPRAVPAPVHAASKPERPACDPPFVIDDKGHKHYKSECLE